MFKRRNSNPISTAFWLLVLLILIAIGHSCAREDKVILTFSDFDRIHTIFEATHSPVPSVMASAVLETAYPYILTGVAVKESNGTPWAIGDSGQSKGAFQVQEKHWGSVPLEASEQAKQAASILEALVESRGSLRCRTTLRRTLAKYNGGTRPPKISYRYADRVIELARRKR